MVDQKTDPNHAVSIEEVLSPTEDKIDKLRWLKVKLLKAESCRGFEAKSENLDKACEKILKKKRKTKRTKVNTLSTYTTFSTKRP